MKLSFERDGMCAATGGALIAERLVTSHISRKNADADELRYGFSGKLAVRYVEVSGYLTSSAETPEDGAAELMRMRRLIARITAPGEFVMRVDGVKTSLSGGELDFVREAPFSGKLCEKFTLRAAMRDGYFHGDERVLYSVRDTADGTTLPLSLGAGEGVSFGTLAGRERINVRNPGDVSVGFTAELMPESSVDGVGIVDRSHGKMIVCKYSFVAGDRVIVTSTAESVGVKLIRGSSETDLAGAIDSRTKFFFLRPGESVLAFYYNSVPIPAKLTYAPAYTSI